MTHATNTAPLATAEPHARPCPHCGNRSHFVGYDHCGYPGACDCDPRGTGRACYCQVTLTQAFTVRADGSVEYAAFEGGGSGAEIGDYTAINCAKCGYRLWEDGAA